MDGRISRGIFIGCAAVLSSCTFQSGKQLMLDRCQVRPSLAQCIDYFKQAYQQETESQARARWLALSVTSLIYQRQLKQALQTFLAWSKLSVQPKSFCESMSSIMRATQHVGAWPFWVAVVSEGRLLSMNEVVFV